MNSLLRFTNQEHVASVLRKPNLPALARQVIYRAIEAFHA